MPSAGRYCDWLLVTSGQLAQLPQMDSNARFETRGSSASSREQSSTSNVYSGCPLSARCLAGLDTGSAPLLQYLGRGAGDRGGGPGASHPRRAGHQEQHRLPEPCLGGAAGHWRRAQIIGGGRFFDKAGDRVVQDGQRYEDSGVRQLYEQ